MAQFLLVAGALAAAIGVAAGAFGAHSLASSVSPDRLATFKTGVEYQMYHALALLLVGWIRFTWNIPALSWAGGLFLAGIFLFSGSLFLLVLTDTPWLGAVTPLGGVAFILGWLLLAWAAYDAAG